MANKTLLNGVNDLFRLASLIGGDNEALTSLTDSARQVDVDNAVLALNQSIDELYSTVGIGLPEQQAESTITLATGTRAYTLATNYVRLHFPLIDKTNSQYIRLFKPGYNEMLKMDPEQDDTGTPMYGCIRPTDGKLYVERAPTSTDNGKVYTYQYDRDTALSLLTDNFPFVDAVYRALIPAAFQLWKRERRAEFDAELFKAHLGRAARLLPKVAPRDDYCPR